MLFIEKNGSLWKHCRLKALPVQERKIGWKKENRYIGAWPTGVQSLSKAANLDLTSLGERGRVKTTEALLERRGHSCSTGRPLLLMDLSLSSVLFLLLSASEASSHRPRFPWASAGRATAGWMSVWVEEGGGRNCPDLSAWVRHLVPGGRDSPEGGSLTASRPPRPWPRRGRLPREHAVGNHGGGSGPRMEEPELPSKGWVPTSQRPEPGWDSDSGYVWDTLL